MRRLGVFGGTFDPVHIGHLGPAALAQATFTFDELLFVPAGKPPHKQNEPLTPFAHRFAMLALATQDNERFLVSDIELRRRGPTYTVDTLRLLRERRASDRIFFIMGSDSFAQIDTWHRWEELVELADLVVLHRATAWGEELAARVPALLRPRLCRVEPGDATGDSEPGRIFLLEHEPFGVSSTTLRERLRAGQPVGDLVPPQVYRYIVKYHLYQHSGEPTDGR